MAYNHDSYRHEDDVWTPINKPTDPCQISGCQLKKHKFPFHYIRQDLQPSGTLSRWCLKHTIEKGFCHHCGKPEIASKYTGMCRDCQRLMMLAGFSPRGITDKLLQRSENDPSPYIITING